MSIESAKGSDIVTSNSLLDFSNLKNFKEIDTVNNYLK